MTDSATAIHAPDILAAELSAAVVSKARAAAVNNNKQLMASTDPLLGTDTLFGSYPLLGTPPAPPTAAASLDSIFSVNTTTFSKLNDVGVTPNPRSASITGNLTMQQMQALGILKQDAQNLEDAVNVSHHIALTNGATTVDLSAIAQSAASVGSTTPDIAMKLLLAPAQIGRIGVILSPIANEPLTRALLLQIQAQLTAAQINPMLISLNTIVMVMNDVARVRKSIPVEVGGNPDEIIGNVVEIPPMLHVDKVTL